MATLSLRLQDKLKRKAQAAARRQGVSLNGYVSSALAAVIAQEETLQDFGKRLKNIDPESLHRRVTTFMSKTRPGREPKPEEIARAIGG